MQAIRSWHPPTGPLGRLSGAAAARADALATTEAALRHRAGDIPTGPSFIEALRGDAVAIVAEVKRRSPSKGAIRMDIDAGSQAAAYARGGAAALSILTEPTEFGGSSDDLAAARRTTALPTLKKDFHVRPIQVLEARAVGASAMLLIARALAPDALRAMADLAADVGVEVLIEVRTEQELDEALAVSNAAIGINSRDLETLIIEPEVTERLLRQIPAHRIAVAESGIVSRGDVDRAARLGADAVLVGSSISAASDPAAAVAALAGVARVGRAG